MATYHSSAYIKDTVVSYNFITVRMYGLDKSYTNTDRKVYYVLNGELVNNEGIELGAGVSDGASYTISGLEQGTTYEIYAFVEGISFSVNVGGGDDSGVSNSPLKVTTLKKYTEDAEVTYSIWGLRADSNSISFHIDAEPYPDDFDSGYYDYFVYLKGSSDDDYWCYDFIGHDTIPRIDEEIILLHGIDSNTKYSIYVEVWRYNELLGTTPTKTITTSKEALLGGCTITSIVRKTSQLVISVKNTGDANYYFAIRGSTTLQSRYSTLHSAQLISPNSTYAFTINITETDKNKSFYIYIFQVAEDFSSDTFYPQSGGTISVGGRDYTIHNSSSSYDSAFGANNVIEIPAPATYSVKFYHYDVDSNQIAPSQTYKIDEEEIITLSAYQDSTLDGYDYCYALDSEGDEVTKAVITEDTCFNLIYQKRINIALWSWESSNGTNTENITENLTYKACDALTNKGLVSDFSYLVWNDLCEKVGETLDAAKGSWKDLLNAEISIDTLLMPQNGNDKTLYASKYNILQWQIYRLAIQYDIVTDAEWLAAIVEPNQKVSGKKHFIGLTSLLNLVIEYINTH